MARTELKDWTGSITDWVKHWFFGTEPGPEPKRKVTFTITPKDCKTKAKTLPADGTPVDATDILVPSISGITIQLASKYGNEVTTTGTSTVFTFNYNASGTNFTNKLIVKGYKIIRASYNDNEYTIENGELVNGGTVGKYLRAGTIIEAEEL